MEKMYVKARAKINLSLEVLGKRSDNYHNLKSVFQKINLYDELMIEKTQSNDIEIISNVQQLNNENNIIYKTYIKMKEQYENITGIKVVLNKKIPMEAGLAGGSTDCASFIICLNKLFNLNLSQIEIENIGKSLGADVIPCLYNGAILAEGIGDKITKINTNFRYYILIVKPDFFCNTGKMFKKIDEEGNINQKHTSNKIVKALENNDIKLIADNLYNVFEEVIDNKEEIVYIKKQLLKNGAVGSLLTGSGSCVYGIFDSKEIVKKAYNTLKNTYKTYMCTSYNSRRE